MGQLTAAIPKAKNQYESATDNAVHSKKQALEEMRITEKQKQRFETLAKHPEAVEKAAAHHGYSPRRTNTTTRKAAARCCQYNTKRAERKMHGKTRSHTRNTEPMERPLSSGKG